MKQTSYKLIDIEKLFIERFLYYHTIFILILMLTSCVGILNNVWIPIILSSVIIFDIFHIIFYDIIIQTEIEIALYEALEINSQK